MTRLVAAALAGLALLLTGCSARHAADPTGTAPPAAAGSAAGPQTTAARPAAVRMTTPVSATSPAPARTTPSASAPTAQPTDLSAVRADLGGAGDAAGAATQHLSSGDAAASQGDNP